VMLLLLQLGTGPASMWVPAHELRNICVTARDANTFRDAFFNTRRF